jgi:predicted RNase H-like HicB family nuclease
MANIKEVMELCIEEAEKDSSSEFVGIQKIVI